MCMNKYVNMPANTHKKTLNKKEMEATPDQHKWLWLDTKFNICEKNRWVSEEFDCCQSRKTLFSFKDLNQVWHF